MRITAALSGGASARGAGPITSLPVRADHVAAVIDDDLGVALRIVWSSGGEQLLTAELTGISDDVDPEAFRIDS
jgi:hypothetical protein